MFVNASVILSISPRLLIFTVRLKTAWVVPLCLAISIAALGCQRSPASGDKELAGGTTNNEVSTESDATATGDAIGTRGGRLVISLRAEPKGFNPLVAFDNPSLEILDLLHAGLVHLEAKSQETLPALAESLEKLDQGRRYVMKLRQGVRFSDGEPFDAEDVVFTYQSLLDPDLEAPQRETLTFDDEPLTVRRLDSHTVEFSLPRPHAGGETLFDGVSIVPEHLLGPQATAGSLREAWAVGDELSEMAGLGPFTLHAYVPGERLELVRNPNYWRRDSAGGVLPYLDEILILFTPSPEAELLRFEAGEIDLIRGFSADAFDRLERPGEGRTVRDLGPGLIYEFLFFNLNDLDPAQQPRLTRKQAWMRTVEFRQALSLAVDRQAIAKLVYRDRATPVAGHITPANHRWHNAAVKASEPAIDRAKELLAQAGFSWRQDGRLIDAEQTTVDLTLVTNASNSRRVETATVVQEDLRRLGIELRVVPLDFGALLDRVYESFDYEIGLLGLGRGGMDPNSSLNVWLSSGDSHLWRLGASGPLSPWQQNLDRLLLEQMVEDDQTRREFLVDEIQLQIAEHMPLVFLVAPSVLVAARSDLGNFAPAPADGATLWNADRLFWRPRG